MRNQSEGVNELCLGDGTKQGGSTDLTLLFLALTREVGEPD